MATDYPGAIDGPMADHGDVEDAVLAIQTALGANPRRAVPRQSGPRTGYRLRPNVQTDTQSVASGNYCVKFPVDWQFSLSAFHFHVQGAGGAGSTLQPAIWAATAGGLPGALIHSGTAVAVNATGTVDHAYGPVTLNPGLYYVGARVVAVTTNPNLYVTHGGAVGSEGFWGDTITATTARHAGYSMAVGTELPANWEANPVSGRWMPLLYLTAA